MKSDQEINESLFEKENLDLLSEDEPNLSESLESLKEEEKPKVVFSGEVRKWMSLLEKAVDPAEKISLCLDFMRAKLSGTNAPKFREFWEVRRLCLPLFKENIALKIRGDLWQQYVDLSIEARRLKGILDEQSTFACEQIDLAIQSLVSDLDFYEERLSQMPALEISITLPPLSSKKDEYNGVQKQLNLLNALAAKVNSLRKEAIKTDMRVRSKNKIFEKLSECGDRIFPRRKELIKKISQDFSEDIATFVKMHFEADKKPSIPMHVLRDEVKSLQSFAKYLTLNTQSFTDTRVALSFCWDQLKAWDKEKKKEISELRIHQKQSYENALVKVKEFQQFCSEQTSIAPVLAKHEEVLLFLKGLPDLGGNEFRHLREELSSFKRPFEEKQKEQKNLLEKQGKEQEEMRLKKLQDVREGIQGLLDNADQMTLEDSIIRKSALEEDLKALVASKSEKMTLERLMRQLKDRFLEVKGKRLLLLSHSDQEKYEELRSLIQEKKERRQEIKHQLEAYRKSLGGSGFDFEKGMMYRELIESEREVLEKMNLAIDELESKMAQLEG